MIVLTKAQLAEIRKLIDDHHLAFFVNVLGGAELVDKKALERLKAMGLIVDPKDALLQDAFRFGRIVDDLKKEGRDVRSMTYDEFKAALKTSRARDPLTQREKATLKAARRKVYEHLKGLGNTVKESTEEVIVEGDKQLRTRLEGEVKRQLVSGLEKRKTIKQIALALGEKTQDYSRDWTRIAYTETNNAFQEGKAETIKSKTTPSYDPMVYKLPRPDACEECKKAYLEKDGVTPRLFKLSELLANGSNVGRKHGDRKPVHGSHHPWCACELQELEPGFGFDENGEVTYVGIDE